MNRLSFVIVLLLPSLACAQSWEDRASRLNSTAVSAEDALARAAADDDQDKRNKICKQLVELVLATVKHYARSILLVHLS
jgi:hypothetical protein